jgi:ligand-binding sensor domain-containing protein
MKRSFARFLGIILAITLASCMGRGTPPATPEVAASPTSPAPAPARVSPASLPRICNCFLRFDHISIEDGLSQSSVRSIFQDSRGFIWFGTEDGLNRYDGYTFKTFKPDPDVTTSLSDRWITDILEDEEGYIWVGTRLGGLNRYDPRTEQFARYLHDDGNPLSLSDNHVNVLYLDRNNQIWVGTGNGLDTLDRATNTFTHYDYNPTKQEGITGKTITDIYQDSRGRFWIGTSAGGLNRFNPQNNTFVPYQHNPGNENTISNDWVTAIVEGRNSTLWIGTRDGLNKFEPDTSRFQRFIHSEIDGQSISSVAEDAGERGEDSWLVVDDQHQSGHAGEDTRGRRGRPAASRPAQPPRQIGRPSAVMLVHSADQVSQSWPPGSTNTRSSGSAPASTRWAPR